MLNSVNLAFIWHVGTLWGVLIWFKLCTLYLGKNRITKVESDLFKGTEPVAGVGMETGFMNLSSFDGQISFSVVMEYLEMNYPYPWTLKTGQHVIKGLQLQHHLLMLIRNPISWVPHSSHWIRTSVLKTPNFLKDYVAGGCKWWLGELTKSFFCLIIHWKSNKYCFKEKSHILHCMWASNDPISLCGRIFSLFPMFPFHYYCFKFHK